jgi:hypothetical protein
MYANGGVRVPNPTRVQKPYELSFNKGALLKEVDAIVLKKEKVAGQPYHPEFTYYDITFQTVDHDKSVIQKLKVMNILPKELKRNILNKQNVYMNKTNMKIVPKVFVLRLCIDVESTRKPDPSTKGFNENRQNGFVVVTPRGTVSNKFYVNKNPVFPHVRGPRGRHQLQQEAAARGRSVGNPIQWNGK